MSRPSRRYTYGPRSTEARVLRGDEEAIGTVSRWIASVLTDLRFWGLQQDWLDLHQDSMVGVLESLQSGRFDPARDFRAYVWAIARYTIRRASADRRRLPRAPHGLAVELRGGEDPLEATSRRLLVSRVLSRMSGECRQLMEAYFCEERSYQELAAAHGIPIGTVKSRLFRCLAEARRLLSVRRGTGSSLRTTEEAEPPGLTKEP